MRAAIQQSLHANVSPPFIRENIHNLRPWPCLYPAQTVHPHQPCTQKRPLLCRPRLLLCRTPCAMHPHLSALAAGDEATRKQSNLPKFPPTSEGDEATQEQSSLPKFPPTSEGDSCQATEQVSMEADSTSQGNEQRTTSNPAPTTQRTQSIKKGTHSDHAKIRPPSEEPCTGDILGSSATLQSQQDHIQGQSMATTEKGITAPPNNGFHKGAQGASHRPTVLHPGFGRRVTRAVATLTQIAGCGLKPANLSGPSRRDTQAHLGSTSTHKYSCTKLKCNCTPGQHGQLSHT